MTEALRYWMMFSKQLQYLGCAARNANGLALHDFTAAQCAATIAVWQL